MTSPKILLYLLISISFKILIAQNYYNKPVDHYKLNEDLTDYNPYDIEFHNPIATNSFEALYNLYDPARSRAGNSGSKLFNLNFLAQLKKLKNDKVFMQTFDKISGIKSCNIFKQN